VSEDLTRDPLLQKLARFTPASDKIDRDAMLFAAGRAAGSTSRGWKLLATGLAMSQAGMLAIWLATPSVTDQLQTQSRPLVADVSPNAPRLEQESDRQTDSPGSYGNLMRHLERDGLPMPESAVDPLPASPVLSADLRSQATSFQ
jgi:hypothetical protein